MPQVIGDSPTDDGVIGIAHAQSKSGVHGISNGAFGEGVTGTSLISHGVHGVNGNGANNPPHVGAGLWGETEFGFGVYGASNANFGVYGASNASNGIHGDSTNGDAVCGIAHAQGKAGVLGISDIGNGVSGLSKSSNGVTGFSATGVGVSASGAIGVTGNGGVAGVSGNSQNIGVAGHGTATGVFGTVTPTPGYAGQVFLTNLPPFPSLSGSGGVFGLAQGDDQFGTIGLSSGKNGAGVFGITTGHGGTGVSGEDYNGIANPLDHSGGTGVSGSTIWGVGVYGLCSNADKSKGWAGRFDGNVQVNGTLFKSAGGFKIDHPLEPNNKYLCHSFVESPEMLNVYSGTVTLDSDGEAPVPLPKWFEALNNDFRYQLTCVGAFAPVYVGEEIKGGTFKIAGGNPGMKVCWQVTGVRCDAYAQQNRLPVEMEKP